MGPAVAPPVATVAPLHHAGIRSSKLKALSALIVKVIVSSNGYAVFTATETLLPSPSIRLEELDSKYCTAASVLLPLTANCLAENFGQPYGTEISTGRHTV